MGADLGRGQVAFGDQGDDMGAGDTQALRDLLGSKRVDVSIDLHGLAFGGQTEKVHELRLKRRGQDDWMGTAQLNAHQVRAGQSVDQASKRCTLLHGKIDRSGLTIAVRFSSHGLMMK
jgi:hypothetical protein